MAISLTSGETALLIDGLSEDVAFVWVLIHLGLRGSPPKDHGAPSDGDIDAAILSLEKLSRAGLVRVGHIEYLDGRGRPTA